MNIHVIQFLIKVKNAILFHKDLVLIHFNKEVLTFLKILYVENFILSFYLLLEKNQIIVKLKTYFKNNLLKNLKVLATSTKSVSISYFKLCRIINKNIFILFSTDKGMLTDVECKIKKVGGKILLSC
jgi:small subunit ribosomal protein S8